MNIERFWNSRMSAGEIETKNWICKRYELWFGSERFYCKVRRKHKKRNRRGYKK